MMHIRPNDFRELMRPSGPLFALLLPWLLVLVGVEIRASDLIAPVSSGFYTLLLVNCATLFVVCIFLQVVAPLHLSFHREGLSQVVVDKWFIRKVYAFVALYLVCELFQVFYFRGVPLVWLFEEKGRVYIDYGIPSVNGALRALYLVATTCLYLVWLQEKKGGQLVLLLVLFSVPFFLLCRQLLVSLFLQVGCLSLLLRPRAWMKWGAAGVGVLAFFIYLGNCRTGLDTFTAILEPADWLPEVGYPLLWVYAYLVTPINNMNANFDSVIPSGSSIYELNTLFPSVFTHYLPESIYDGGFDLVHRNLTVSTFYFEPLLDFGPIYAVVFMAIFQLLLVGSYRGALFFKTPQRVVHYTIFYMIAVLSVFANLFLYLPVVFQLVIVQFLRPLRKERSHQ